MPLFLRQSTASQEVPLGYFVDSVDGNTEETALSIANTDIKIWKTGATTLANKNSGGATHISNGVYYCVLDATDTDTIGPLVVFIHVSGALTVRLECCVLDEAVYDSLFGTSALTTGGAITVTSGRVNADVTHWLGTAAATPTVAGVPEVDITHIAGSAVNTSSAQIGVNVVNAAGTAWGSGAITAGSIAPAAFNHSKFNNDVGFKAIRQATAQAGTASTITLDASSSATDDFYNNDVIVLVNNTGAGQARRIRDYVGATKVATITPDWIVNPDATSAFAIMPATSSYDEVTADHAIAGTTGDTLSDAAVSAADIQTKIGTPANLGGGATLANNLSDIKAQTDDIGAAGAGLTAVPWNAAWDAEVQSEVEDALVVHRLDELLNADSDIDGAAPPTVGSVFHELLTKTTGSFTYDQTTDSLEAIRDRGDAAWTTGGGGSNPSVLQSTTIATLASQASFTLTAGSADNNAYNGAVIVVTDQSTSTQKAVGIVSAYTGSSKTVTLEKDPGIFTMAVGDTVDIIAAKFDNRPRRGVAFTWQFLMVDATDLKTEELGLTVSVTLSKDGGAFAASTNSVTEIGTGHYKVTLTATEMDAAQIWIRATATGAANRHVPILTQP